MAKYLQPPKCKIIFRLVASLNRSQTQVSVFDSPTIILSHFGKFLQLLKKSNILRMFMSTAPLAH